MENKPTIGFIGLGRMGYPMARNLLKAGYSLNVFDLIPEKIAALTEYGAASATSPADATRNADVVITMVLDDAALEAVTLGPQGILESALPGVIHADMSTVSPMASVRVAAEANKKNIRYLRAKVSGSIRPAT